MLGFMIIKSKKDKYNNNRRQIHSAGETQEM
jgi:hypothetical protein